MEKIIYQLDAFTDVRFGGNPAGVVPDATGLTEEQMQKIAMEMNLSETAFVIPLKKNGIDYEVRFFTPEQEVDLCGHATIGAFYALATKGYLEGKDDKIIVKQRTKAGILPVEIYFEKDKVEKIMMTQAAPEFLFTITDTAALAEVMGIEAHEIGMEDCEVLPQVVSTGLPDIIMPVKSLEVLKKLKPKRDKLIEYSKRHGVISVHVFTFETEAKDSTLACRNFAPAVGIDEEAATGTSNGALGAYLLKNGLVAFQDEITLICEQGHYIGRPSKVIVKLEGSKENFTVKVGGKAVITLEGIMIYG
ncbi:PhzF family phenazine biosynthesis protein [Thermotalea metallivorans]|uniref:Putative isomerase YddE n=1 Tax=Thermotalea metallivorans TaxID=520762 RepID=A0A140KZX8_9FIRM|nr:PhzF family phenazine biosynthesis protein [Thermotalea metallivorans]KXG73853.1 putative isomerase YddE [Thermotalea metallivorans]